VSLFVGVDDGGANAAAASALVLIGNVMLID
jgi:hypothetical protein